MDEVRDTLGPLGYGDAEVQTVEDPALGANIVQISTGTLRPEEVTRVQDRLDQRFGIDQAEFTSSSVGPTFGTQIARTAVLAIIVSLILISLYIGLRFEFKYAVPVLIALCHDLLITAGVYALFGREVTTATVAALLTILGYSLYDTIIVFDRIRENVPRMPRATYSQIVNRSMSEVLTRSLVTSFSALMPIAALMVFGGETLRDFAFALLVGVFSGAYSSIFIAAPVLVEWKEREPLYRRRRKLVRQANNGVIPPSPTRARPPPPRSSARPPLRPTPGRSGRGGAAPPRPRRHRRRRRRQRRRRRRRRLRLRLRRSRRSPPRRATATGPSRPAGPPAPRRAQVGGPSPSRRASGPATESTGGGSAMAMLVWVMMGIAVWHFTVFVPDHFYGGIVLAFLAAVVGSAVFGVIVSGFTIPGQSDTDLVQAFIAIPGALIALAALYFYGAARDRAAGIDRIV